MPSTLDIQTRLKVLGFDPGALDGIRGRRTIDAIRSFQGDRGLETDGLAGPITLKELFGRTVTKTDANASGAAQMRPWFDLALSKKGFIEGEARTKAFLKSDGKTLGDPSRLPWCGDFVETCISLSLPREKLPANPYLARNWLTFGIGCAPTLGAIAVFWRGSRNGTSGHVGFVAGKGDGALYILGGNQSNRVSIAPLDTARLLGTRWPSSAPLGPTVLPTMKGGKLSVNEA